MPETDIVRPMTGRWVRAVTIVTGVATIMVACSTSNGPEPAAPLESAEPITAPPSTEPVATTSTTDAVPDTTAEPAAPTTMSATTSVVPTTEPAPSTTTLENLRAEIEADLNEGEQAFLELGATPTDPATIEQLSKYYVAESLDSVAATFASLANDGNSLRIDPQTRSSQTVIAVLDAVVGRVTIRRCRIDAGQVVRADDPTSVVNDEVVRFISIVDVVFDEGRWKLEGGELVSEEQGERTCAGV